MPYPLPVFHFSVVWGGTTVTFSEVTGLNIEVQPIEYRDGNNPDRRQRHAAVDRHDHNRRHRRQKEEEAPASVMRSRRRVCPARRRFRVRHDYQGRHPLTPTSRGPAFLR